MNDLSSTPALISRRNPAFAAGGGLLFMTGPTQGLPTPPEPVRLHRLEDRQPMLPAETLCWRYHQPARHAGFRGSRRPKNRVGLRAKGPIRAADSRLLPGRERIERRRRRIRGLHLRRIPEPAQQPLSDRRVGTSDRRLGTTHRRVGTTHRRLGTSDGRVGTTHHRLGTTHHRVGTTHHRVGTTHRRLGSSVRADIGRRPGHGTERGLRRSRSPVSTSYPRPCPRDPLGAEAGFFRVRAQ
jgi:hypothetical protein